MRSYDTTTAAYLEARGDIIARHLVWVTAKERSTGNPASVGIWTGDDTRQFTIGGQARTYYAAGGLLNVEAVSASVGLDVRMRNVRLSPLAPEVEQLIRGYDTRLADYEEHRALFNTADGGLIAEPMRVFHGTVNAVSLPTAAAGGELAVELTVAGAARSLTRPLSLVRSNAAMQARSATDDFRAYTDIAGEVGVWWGEKQKAIGA